MQLDELHEGLQEVAARAPGGDVDARAVVLRRGRHLARRRRLAQATGVVAVAAVLAAGLVAVRTDHPRPGRTITTSPSTSTPATPFRTSPSGIDTLPAPNLSPRGGEAVVWTGTHLVVWGGYLEAANLGVPGPDGARNDGAFLVPGTRTWTPMSASPLTGDANRSAGTPTDDGVVFTRGRATALWDPRTNTWRRLGDAPRVAADLTFTGSLVASVSANATLDLRTGEWQGLPAQPLFLDRSTATWTGKELVVIGGPGTPFTSAEGMALDPAQREWRRIANLPTDVHAEALASDWDGHRIVVVNYDMRAVAYDPVSDKWTTLPSVPARFGEWSPSARSAGGYTVVFMGAAVVVLTPDGTWVPLPYGDIPFGTFATTRPSFVAQAGDDALYVLGIDAENGARHAVVRVDPARLIAAAHRFKVGVGSVQAPPDYLVTGASYNLESETVQLNLAGPGVVPGRAGPGCSITSRYTGIPGAAPGAPVTGFSEESLRNDGKPTQWYRSPSGEVWQVGPATADEFIVRCSPTDVARAVAASASFK